MTDADSILAAAQSILVVDWPSRDVPDSLVLAGLDVVVHGGPGPEDFVAYEVVEGQVVERRVGHPPERAEVVYTHRPLDELPEIVDAARRAGAGAVWIQSGRSATGDKDPAGCWLPEDAAASARAVVESAGLVFLDRPYIGDVARRLGSA